MRVTQRQLDVVFRRQQTLRQLTAGLPKEGHERGRLLMIKDLVIDLDEIASRLREDQSKRPLRGTLADILLAEKAARHLIRQLQAAVAVDSQSWGTLHFAVWEWISLYIRDWRVRRLAAVAMGLAILGRASGPYCDRLGTEMMALNALPL